MPDDLRAAFIFVPHGDPPPLEWMKQHPGWIKIPALLVPHEISEDERRHAVADFQAGRQYRAGVEDDMPPEPVGAPIVRRHERPARSTDPGVVVHLPDGRPIPDKYDAEHRLRAPVSSLDEVAKAGRETGENYRLMLKFGSDGNILLQQNPLEAISYLGFSLLRDIGHGGRFDYQRQGSYVTGWTQLPQFRDVSNFDVGLYCQQAGLSEDETLRLAGLFAFFRSRNHKPDNTYGLDDQTREFIQEGYAAGASGAYGRPPQSND